MRTVFILFILSFLWLFLPAQTGKKAADFNIKIGVMQAGKYNAITDVAGVKVGHTTIIKADSIRTGVTARSSEK